MTAHTPTPWENRIFEDRAPFVVGGNGQNVLSSHRLSSEVEANVRLIVRAVNSHAELVAAVESLLQFAVAWRYEYADKPQDAHNNAQRDRIDAAVNGARAALAKARE